MGPGLHATQGGPRAEARAFRHDRRQPRPHPGQGGGHGSVLPASFSIRSFAVARSRGSHRRLHGKCPPEDDPIVPSNYVKVDPEFFTEGQGFELPVPLTLHYARHLASERFQFFRMQMQAEASDMMSVPVTPRTWHALDARSPLMIFDVADLNCIGDDEVKHVVTKDRLVRVLTLFYASSRAEIVDSMRAKLFELAAGAPGPLGLGSGLTDPLALISAAAVRIRGFVATIRGLVGSIGPLGDILGAVDNIVEGLEDLRAAIRARLNQARDAVLDWFIGRVADAMVPILIDWVATSIDDDVHDPDRGGFAALGVPAWIGTGLILWKLQEDGILKAVPKLASPLATTLRIPIDIDELVDNFRNPRRLLGGFRGIRQLQLKAGCSPRTELALDIPKAMKFLTETDNVALRHLVDDFITAARKRRRALIPNAPPPSVPTYKQVVYKESVRVPPIPQPLPTVRSHERRAIDFIRVMDLGIGTVHWNEHWQECFGGEIQNLLARRPLFQKEQFSLALNRFINGPIIDGDGWQDGTTNFYILVELARRAGSRPGQRRFAVLYIDEQTYFSQRWRLVDPTEDAAAEIFSLAASLHSNPEYHRFERSHYWDPFVHDCIHSHSRMAVARQILAVTGIDPLSRRPEIYTTSFSYGISDRTWRWRVLPAAASAEATQDMVGAEGKLPAATEATVFPQTLGIREDTTLHVRGWGAVAQLAGTAVLKEGRWIQRYLPADCRMSPMAHELDSAKPVRGYAHPWSFVTEEAFDQMDRFYLFGAYEPEVDARCQYYEVEIVPDANGNLPPDDVLSDRLWLNLATSNDRSHLRIDTTHLNWEPELEDDFLRLSRVTTDRSQATTMSMYEPATRFRLRKRSPNGYIAIFADKRDDDLQTASHLPQRTKMYAILAPNHQWRTIELIARTNQRVLRPPAVQKVEVQRIVVSQRTVGLRIRFWTSLPQDEAKISLWRVSLGHPAQDGVILRKEIFGHFTRQGVPSSPCHWPTARPTSSIVLSSNTCGLSATCTQPSKPGSISSAPQQRAQNVAPQSGSKTSWGTWVCPTSWCLQRLTGSPSQ